MTEEENSKSESKEQPPEKERRFDMEQYKLLKECAKKGPEGIAEWNEWLLFEEVWLPGVYLRNANLQGVDLGDANLQGAEGESANLQRANLNHTNLQRADLKYANLQGADLGYANLQGANLWKANLQGADLRNANLQGAILKYANLQGAIFEYANLQGANLRDANLQGANLWKANLQGAKLIGVIVNGSTSFLNCKIDEDTDFRYTDLGDTLITPGTEILLKYNIRRMNWRNWYAYHRFLQWPGKLFWSISNYGISTSRIMLTFFALAFVFAIVYLSQPCCVMVNGVVGDIRGFVHALYFSVVTMTTLGFGDIAANPDSWLGQVVLMIQVILGYVLLGALVTRLAVLFTSDGPAGSFTPMDKETKELLAKLKEDKSN